MIMKLNAFSTLWTFKAESSNPSGNYHGAQSMSTSQGIFLFWQETTTAQNCKGFLINQATGALILGITYAYTEAHSNVLYYNQRISTDNSSNFILFTNDAGLQRLWVVNSTDLSFISGGSYTGIANPFGVHLVFQNSLFIGGIKSSNTS